MLALFCSEIVLLSQNYLKELQFKGCIYEELFAMVVTHLNILLPQELGTHEENMAFLWQSLNSLHYQMETGTTGKCTQEKTPKTGRITTNDFVNCLSSPEVLKLITGQLMRKLGGKTGTPRELGMASTAHKICSCATIVGSISHLVPDSCSSTDQQVCECRTKVTARDSKTEFQRHESERNQDVPVDTHAERKKPRLDFEEGRIP